jgi:hypothetical protein
MTTAKSNIGLPPASKLCAELSLSSRRLICLTVRRSNEPQLIQFRAEPLRYDKYLNSLNTNAR